MTLQRALRRQAARRNYADKAGMLKALRAGRGSLRLPTRHNPRARAGERAPESALSQRRSDAYSKRPGGGASMV